MNKGKIITCISTVEGNGAKYSATLMAFDLRQRYPKAKIALVDLDLFNPYLYGRQTANDTVHGVDNIVDKISANIMMQADFLDNMIKIEGLFDLLKGTRKVGRENLVTHYHITKIYQSLRENYDYVIAVVPPKANNAATSYGLHGSDAIVLVTRPNYANLSNIEVRIDICETHRKSIDVPVYLLFNMRTEQDDIDSFIKYIEASSAYVIGQLEFEPKTIDNQNIGGSFMNDLTLKAGKLFKNKKSVGNEDRIHKAMDKILKIEEENEDEQ